MRAAGNGELAVSVWVRLLKAHGLMLRELRRRLPGGLTLPQFDVLVQLHRAENGMTHGELSRALLVTAGNLTGLVERLAGLGLVERKAVPGDRRAVRLRLTAQGRRAVQRVLPRHRRDVARLMRGVTQTDLSRLRASLGRLNRALEGP
ncbi:MAG TPA: MarR family transcriptional regulator [Vicinamibacteria bacterium]